MHVSENVFTGDFNQLFKHWNNETRARRFTTGGTRTQAVQEAIMELSDLFTMEKARILDAGCGAGFVESVMPRDLKAPRNDVMGLDFSYPMLHLAKQNLTYYALGSIFQVPVRPQSMNLVFSFFVLSDYYNLEDYFFEVQRILVPQGVFAVLDYEKNDEYWRLRQALHGKHGIMGNIHLRTTTSFQALLPRSWEPFLSTTISYEIPNTSIMSYHDLLDIALKEGIINEFEYHKRKQQPLKRSFLFVLARKKGE